ncbi:MAG: hypothetical protein QXX77_07070 [Candidatus Methanosuratincola sp.]
MPSRIIVYKGVLVGWLLLSGTIGYLMIAKVDWLFRSLKDEGDGALDRVFERMIERMKGELQGVSVDLEGFSEWASSMVGRQR